MVTGPERERVLQKIRSFHARGMTYVQMEAQSGVPVRTIANALEGWRGSIKRPTLVALTAVQFEEPEPHVRVSGLGTRRRLGGLWCAGYPTPLLTELLGVGNRGYLQKVIRGRKGDSVTAATRLAVERLAGKLEVAKPGDFGIDARRISYCKTFAAKAGCVPLGCWDADNIDDPEAQPEWTGACGTTDGVRIHRREGIPVCSACRQADLAEVKESGSGFSPGAFRRIREARGMSRRQLCNQIGMDESSIFYWETGRSEPRQRTLDRALSVLGATFEDVCESEES